MTDRPVCKCHGEPMYWATETRESRPSFGGYWRCAVKKREHERARYARHREQKLERQRDYYREHGWKVKRLNDLRNARGRVITEMEALSARTVT